MIIHNKINIENSGYIPSISATTTGELVISPRKASGTEHVGISINNPNAALHIRQTDNTRGQGQIFVDAQAFGSQYEATVMFGHAGNVRGIFGYQNEVGKMHLKRSIGATAFSAITNNAAMTWDLNGGNINRIGINNESPLAALDVSSNSPTITTGLFAGGGDDSNGYALRITNSDGTELFGVRNDGFIGINVSSPTATLHIVASGNTTGTTVFLVENSDNDTIMSLYGDGSVEFGKRTYFNTITGTTGTGYTADLSQSNIFKLTADDNFTLDYTNAKTGTYIFIIQQDGGGSNTISFASSKFRAAGGNAPSLSTAAGATDILSCIYSEEDNRMYVYSEVDFQDL